MSLTPLAAAAPSAAPGVPRAVPRGYDYLIELGPYALRVDPDDGGRILSFSLDGRSVIASRDESPDAYGSSFWTSPQTDWSWPPPAELDKLSWTASVEGESLALESRTNAKLGLSARQRIAAEPLHGSFVIEYTLTNRGEAARRVAPWQNTRVRPGGLTFFPSTGATLPGSAFALSPQKGILWYRHDPAAAAKQNGKLFADGAEGWLAHVDGDRVFVKVFPDVPRASQAPKEAEIELYVHESGRFVEVEQQGPYQEIAPGASSTWTVHWLVRRLPPGIDAEQGSAELVAFVRKLVGELRSSRSSG